MRILLAVTQVCPLFLNFEVMRSSKPVAYLDISYLDHDSVGCDAGLPLFLNFEVRRSSKPVAYLDISDLDEDSVGCDAGLPAVPEL